MKCRFVFVILLVLGGSAMAIEEPKYEVIRKYDGFELRRYESYIVAETVVSGEFSQASNRAFGILFNYISGANRARTKIAMTAPVEQSPSSKGEKVEMTAPVVQQPEAGKAGSYSVSFVMPSTYTMETVPEPTDSRVNIRQVEARLVAVHKYSGSWSKERYSQKEKALKEAIKEAGLVEAGAPVFARYNSPFALIFMRRNEVQIEVKPDSP